VSGKSMLELTDAEIDGNLRVNLHSHFYTIRAFLPDMLAAGRGTIVTMSSVLGHLGCANLCSCPVSYMRAMLTV
jgi:NAD(P)-dependent dehydrogenase (short-subunit alcohol dehydrogenase family)